MVKRPQGLSASALTTTSDSTARMMIMMASTPTSASDPGIGPQLHLDHLAQRLAVAPHRGEEHDEVLHGAGDHDADENPHRPRQEAHLRRQHRSHQRSGAGDRGEVVTVEHPLVRRHVVHAVVVPLGRRLAAVVEHEHLLGDELAVEAVGDEIRRECGGHQPDGVDVLAAVERQRSERERTDDGDAAPDEDGRELVHGASDFLFGTRRFPLAGGQPASHRRRRNGRARHCAASSRP